jgi:hypothetical protein
VLAACVLATLFFWSRIGEFALLLPIVVGHFFLFCNVFRLVRHLELAWAGVFVVNTAVWQAVGGFSWWGILAVQTPVTVGVIAREMLSARYHGILARRLNPQLDAYLGVSPETSGGH